MLTRPRRRARLNPWRLPIVTSVFVPACPPLSRMSWASAPSAWLESEQFPPRPNCRRRRHMRKSFPSKQVRRGADGNPAAAAAPPIESAPFPPLAVMEPEPSKVPPVNVIVPPEPPPPPEPDPLPPLAAIVPSTCTMPLKLVI